MNPIFIRSLSLRKKDANWITKQATNTREHAAGVVRISIAFKSEKSSATTHTEREREQRHQLTH